jgi:REP element-mobilizing transposase RayT
MEYRRLRNLPLHSPPHWAMGFSAQYLITAACFEHAPIIGQSPERLTECEEQILAACQQHASKVYAWSVLPNHYHILLGSRRIKSLCRELGRFHGRSSFEWTGQDGQRGRQVWFRCFDQRSSWTVLAENAPPRFGETTRFWITAKVGHLVWSSVFRRLTSKGRIPPKGGTSNLTQHPLNHTITRFQSFGEFLWLVAAAFGHVGFAAAFATDDRREFFDDLSSRNFLSEIV